MKDKACNNHNEISERKHTYVKDMFLLSVPSYKYDKYVFYLDFKSTDV